jgi:hypothetical protein
MAMTEQDNRRAPRVLTEKELRSRRARNIAIGLGLAVLVALFYAVTMVKLGLGARPT